MNSKGFTLVEVLSVIVLLGLILVIVGTKGFGAFDNAKVAIDNQNKEAIIEGAKVLLVEIENCEGINDNHLNTLLSNKGTSCENININKKVCDILNGASCAEEFLDKNGYTTIDCDDIECDYSKRCIDVELKYLVDEEYVIGDGVQEILKNNPNYSLEVCLDGSVQFK